jgi:hypothetical protein
MKINENVIYHHLTTLSVSRLHGSWKMLVISIKTKMKISGEMKEKKDRNKGGEQRLAQNYSK